MIQIPLFQVVAVLGVVGLIPAQSSMQAKFGRFLRGAASVAQAGHRLHCAPVVVQPRVPHYAPVPHCQPAPRGHWETVQEQVMVPGFWQEQHVPPTYGWILQSCGHQVWGVIDAGGCRQVWIPARWETRCRQVWVSC